MIRKPIVVLAIFAFWLVPMSGYSCDWSCEIVRLTNQYRMTNGIHALNTSKEVTEAAQKRAEYLAQNQIFSHSSPDGRNTGWWIEQAGYRWRGWGENLAIFPGSPENVVNAWINSKSHRNIITRERFIDTGVGIAPGVYLGRPTLYVVQLFAKPQ